MKHIAATQLQIISDLFKIRIGYKQLHFEASNKVMFTRKTSFYTKSSTLESFVINFYLHLVQLTG